MPRDLLLPNHKLAQRTDLFQDSVRGPRARLLAVPAPASSRPRPRSGPAPPAPAAPPRPALAPPLPLPAPPLARAATAGGAAAPAPARSPFSLSVGGTRRSGLAPAGGPRCAAGRCPSPRLLGRAPLGSPGLVRKPEVADGAPGTRPRRACARRPLRHSAAPGRSSAAAPAPGGRWRGRRPGPAPLGAPQGGDGARGRGPGRTHPPLGAAAGGGGLRGLGPGVSAGGRPPHRPPRRRRACEECRAARGGRHVPEAWLGRAARSFRSLKQFAVVGSVRRFFPRRCYQAALIS